jgi:hypothetical protein
LPTRWQKPFRFISPILREGPDKCFTSSNESSRRNALFEFLERPADGIDLAENDWRPLK